MEIITKGLNSPELEAQIQLRRNEDPTKKSAGFERFVVFCFLWGVLPPPAAALLMRKEGKTND